MYLALSGVIKTLNMNFLCHILINFPPKNIIQCPFENLSWNKILVPSLRLFLFKQLKKYKNTLTGNKKR